MEVIIWSKLEVIIWSKLGALKKRQLGPDNNFQNVLRAIFSQKNVPKPVFLLYFLAIGVLEKKNKLGPDNNFPKPQTWTR